jgi:curli production assembly/transport component CsgF
MIFPKLRCALLMLASFSCHADQLIYTPVNPTFGGNPNNAAGLLAIANAQNSTKAPTTPTTPTAKQTPLEKFNAALLNAVLARVNTNLVNDLVKANGDLIENSKIQSGNYEISVVKGDASTCNGVVGCLVLQTRDVTIPGSSTSIVVGTSNP